MEKHFMVSYNNLRRGRLHVLVSSAFSHATLPHLFSNMHTILSVGPQLQSALGRGKFIQLYLLGGIASSIATTVWHRQVPCF